MEYAFGINHKNEILRTKNDVHTNLKGFKEIIREYPDQIITDYFLIRRKIDSQEDAEGTCYDWYEIDKHYRFTDKSGPVKDMLNESLTEIEDALCEQDIATEERLAAIEDALCEMDIKEE